MSAAPQADYAGPFDPGFEPARLARPALAGLARETMLFAHLHDRALMPLLGARFGPEAMTQVACDEWMGASPLYNRRNRALLGIEGDGVSAILKSLQLDIGFPHQYMDVRYAIRDETLGWFWLPFCGAYQDVHRFSGGAEPAIVQLCHHMEDPTFDATAMAVNPRARIRPEHRPPLPADHEGSTCRWRVFLGAEAGEAPEPPVRRAVAASRAAGFRFAPPPEEAGSGLRDYAGPLYPDFALERLARPVLARQCQEFALDVHLLMRAAFTSIRDRFGAEVATALAREQWAGLAPVLVPRVRRALGIEGDDVASILKTLQVDPAFPREYLRTGCSLRDDARGCFWIEACEAAAEGEPEAWLALLHDPDEPGFDAVVTAVQPRARLRPLDPSAVPEARGPVVAAWEILVDASAAPRPEPPLANAVRASNASSFRFRAAGARP